MRAKLCIQYSNIPVLLLLLVSLVSCSGGGGGGTGVIASGSASVTLQLALPGQVAALHGSETGAAPSMLAELDGDMLNLLIPDAWAAATAGGIGSLSIDISNSNSGSSVISDVFSATAGSLVSRTYNLPIGGLYALDIRAFSGSLGTGTWVYQGRGSLDLSAVSAGQAVQTAVSVTPLINVPPVPTAAAISTSTGVSTTAQVTPNDPNTGDTHTYAIAANPLHGTATVSASGLVSYSPANGFSGSDTLSVTVTDQGGLTGTVDIAVTVNVSLSDTAPPLVTAPAAIQPSATLIDFAGIVVNSLSIDPLDSTLLYAATDNGIYKSSDSGATWALSGNAPALVNHVAIDPTNTSVLYLASGGNGIWKSVDRGATWTQLSGTGTNFIAIDPANAAKLVAVGANGVLVSSNSGSTWSSANRGLLNPKSNRVLYESSRIYLATEDGLYTSSDSAVTWQLSSALGYVRIPDITKQGSTVYALTESATGIKQLFVTSNAGQSWTEVGASAFSNLRLLGALAGEIASASGRLYAGTESNGLFRSTDGGSTWVAANSGLADLHLDHGVLFPNGTNLTVYMQDSKGAVYQSLDGAVSWTKMSGSGAPKTLATIATFLAAATADDAVDGSLHPVNNAPAIFPVGATSVTFSAQDTAGNTGTASSTVTVPDIYKPRMSTPQPSNLRLADTSGNGIVKTDTGIAAWLNQAFGIDNLDHGVITVVNNAPATLPHGTTSISFSIHDLAGNSTTASGSIEVIAATTRISTDSTGTQATGGSLNSAISADGLVVAFESDASNLVASDSNGSRDIFVKKLQDGSITRVSTNSSGIQGDAASGGIAISADGRYVAFASLATNLVSSDTNAAYDVFVKDTTTGTTTRISTDSAGTEAIGGASIHPSISADGRYVAFSSLATNLVAGDTNAVEDIFVKDTTTGATTRISTDSTGTQATGGASSYPAISADGQVVAFASAATDLVVSDSNGSRDVFVKKLQDGSITRVSASNLGIQGDAASGVNRIAISADGRYVVFDSAASTLLGTSGDNNAATDVFVKDTISGGSIVRVSTDSAGTEAIGGASIHPSISADGRYVAFSSLATNLVAGDTNAVEDVFVKDTTTGATTRISTDSTGTQATSAASSNSAISADGRSIVYDSIASDLVTGDSNSVNDIFRKFR